MHVLMFVVLATGYYFLHRKFMIPVLYEDPSYSTEVAGRDLLVFAPMWGSLLFGALLAKGIRLRRKAHMAKEGFRMCERCQYPVEADSMVCPRCGDAG